MKINIDDLQNGDILGVSYNRSLFRYIQNQFGYIQE